MDIGFFQALIALALYMLPSFIAAGRKHHNSTPLLIVNLFLGWTLLGWFVCFVWSFTYVKT
ncbi:superinfection immunity protein [Vibrio nereis]|uniref:superinfection immunity protein n=1 Tax=Vibrio nereis TaxID=693 RepID=UPI002493FC0B|nr:superinfection immunity protein [Vibrio nereis]